MIDYNAWTVDLLTGTARHASGAIIQVEGDVASPSAVDPSHFPKQLDFMQQARLLRTGMEALAEAARQQAPGSKLPGVKSSVVEALEEQAKMFAERPDKPKRPVLSRKKTPA
ncbi:MAG TPA: hypothetical protein VIC08_12275 [Cellvibrionaceae bacterium]